MIQCHSYYGKDKVNADFFLYLSVFNSLTSQSMTVFLCMYYYNLIDLNIFDEFGPIEVIIVIETQTVSCWPLRISSGWP